MWNNVPKPDTRGTEIAQRKYTLIVTMHCIRAELYNKRLITARGGNCFSILDWGTLTNYYALSYIGNSSETAFVS